MTPQAFSTSDLLRLASSEVPVDPLDFVTPSRMTPERRYAANKAFQRLLNNPRLNWERVRSEINALLDREHVRMVEQIVAAEDTLPVFALVPLMEHAAEIRDWNVVENDAGSSLAMVCRRPDGQLYVTATDLWSRTEGRKVDIVAGCDVHLRSAEVFQGSVWVPTFDRNVGQWGILNLASGTHHWSGESGTSSKELVGLVGVADSLFLTKLRLKPTSDSGPTGLPTWCALAASWQSQLR